MTEEMTILLGETVRKLKDIELALSKGNTSWAERQVVEVRDRLERKTR